MRTVLPTRSVFGCLWRGRTRRCAGPAATRSGTHDGSHLGPYLPHCEAVSSHHHEQVLVAATKNHPAWVAIAAQVSAQFRDRQHRVTCRRSRWKWHLRRVPQHGDVVGVQDRARGNVPVWACGSAEAEKAPGDRDEEAEGIQKCLSALQLPLLECATSLERLEELLDPPATTVAVNHLENVSFAVDGVGSDEEPLHSLFFAGRLDLSYGNDVDGQRLCALLAVRWAPERYRRGADR